MKITTAQRFRPFSHRIGSYALIPHTNIIVRVYPGCVQFWSLDREKSVEIKLAIQGPMEGFTIMQDLEKGHLCVFGSLQNGYFRYRLDGKGGKIVLFVERCPKGGIEGTPFHLYEKSMLPIMNCISYVPIHIPRLALGNHKKQDVTSLRELSAILPLLYRIGYMVPIEEANSNEGAFSLLSNMTGQKKDLSEALRHFYQASIQDLFVPKVFDHEYQGIIPSKEAPNYSSALLRKGSELIESLFFQEREKELIFLPGLPRDIHCGRFMQLASKQKAFTLDMEWKSKTLRGVILRGYANATYKLSFPASLRSYRLQTSAKEKRMLVQDPLQIYAGQTYLLDRFQK